MREVYAIIPARGGSKRIPRKNIREFHGKPMLHYPIAAAQANDMRVIVSTDDDEIAETAISAGAQVLERPGSLAIDEVGTREVTRHAIKALDLKGTTPVCCLYPCTPLIERTDLYWSEVLLWAGGTFVVSVGTRPSIFDAGALYWASAGTWLGDAPLWGVGTRLYDVAERAVDINTEEDWRKAWMLYQAIHTGVPVVITF